MAGMDNFSQQVQSDAQQGPERPMPLALRAMTANPFQFKASALMGWNMNRYANTMFEGGFLDVSTGATGKRAAVRSALGRRTGAFSGSTLQDNSAYAMGKMFRQNMPSWTGKLGKSFEEGGRKIKGIMANLPTNPFAFRRFDSVARLAGSGTIGQAGVYQPIGNQSNFLGAAFRGKNPISRALRNRFSDYVDPTTGQAIGDKPLYTGGVFGRINTMGRVMDYEKQVDAFRALGPRNPASYTRGEARIARRAQKAAAKLEKFDENIVRLGKQTNASYATVGARKHLESTAMRTFGVPIDITDDMVSGVLKTGAADASIAVEAKTMGRLRSMSETVQGTMSKGITDYFGIMMGGGAQFEGTKAFTKLSQTFGKAMESSKIGFSGGALGDVDAVGHFMKTAYGSTGYVDEAVNLLKTGDLSLIRSTTSQLGMEALARKEYGTAAKMLGHYAGTYGKVAGKALSVYGTASMVYDIGKGVGKMIMGGVNLGKEAVKSMQGSLNKPLFGAGFKDNEVAATSRARGVMAIQNSRLNARSMLGSEGGMLAAHFG